MLKPSELEAIRARWKCAKTSLQVNAQGDWQCACGRYALMVESIPHDPHCPTVAAWDIQKMLAHIAELEAQLAAMKAKHDALAITSKSIIDGLERDLRVMVMRGACAEARKEK